MNCSNCGAENPIGLKFYEQCATPFKKRCTRCGFENSASARFCGECAASLSAAVRDFHQLALAVKTQPPAEAVILVGLLAVVEFQARERPQLAAGIKYRPMSDSPSTS